MNYELAKQLKEEGFPQLNQAFRDLSDDTKRISDPSLEELIHAIGRNNFQLNSDAAGNWSAYQFITAVRATGATPSEAVARLWLAHDHKK